MYRVIFWEGTDIVDRVDFEDALSAIKYKERARLTYKLGAVTVHDMYDAFKTVSK
jgi:hypothetical protein